MDEAAVGGGAAADARDFGDNVGGQRRQIAEAAHNLAELRGGARLDEGRRAAGRVHHVPQRQRGDGAAQLLGDTVEPHNRAQHRVKVNRRVGRRRVARHAARAGGEEEPGGGDADVSEPSLAEGGLHEHALPQHAALREQRRVLC